VALVRLDDNLRAAGGTATATTAARAATATAAATAATEAATAATAEATTATTATTTEATAHFGLFGYCYATRSHTNTTNKILELETKRHSSTEIRV
jgi:hypothetical protein